MSSTQQPIVIAKGATKEASGNISTSPRWGDDDGDGDDDDGDIVIKSLSFGTHKNDVGEGDCDEDEVGAVEVGDVGNDDDDKVCTEFLRITLSKLGLAEKEIARLNKLLTFANKQLSTIEEVFKVSGITGSVSKKYKPKVINETYSSKTQKTSPWTQVKGNGVKKNTKKNTKKNIRANANPVEEALSEIMPLHYNFCSSLVIEKFIEGINENNYTEDDVIEFMSTRKNKLVHSNGTKCRNYGNGLHCTFQNCKYIHADGGVELLNRINTECLHDADAEQHKIDEAERHEIDKQNVEMF